MTHMEVVECICFGDPTSYVKFSTGKCFTSNSKDVVKKYNVMIIYGFKI